MSAGRRRPLLAAGVAAALAVVTAAHYFFRFIAVRHPPAVLPVYCGAAALLLLGGYFILYRAARRSYETHRGLTPFSLFLLCANWGLFLALASLFGPYDWAWSWSSAVRVPPLAALAARLLIVAGTAGLLAAIAHLGVLRTLGQSAGRLRRSGPYRISRNPQFASFWLAMLGFLLLRPSGYAAGWVALFAWLSSWMIRAEEEHLRRVFGKEYDEYRARTARFLGWRRQGGGGQGSAREEKSKM